MDFTLWTLVHLRLHAGEHLGAYSEISVGSPGPCAIKHEVQGRNFMSLKIMVVDEEAKAAQLLRAVATPLGHMVLSVEDYLAAGQKSETQRFDLFFVGMRLPDRKGLELAHRIRTSEANREATIVMLSTADETASLRQAFGEGADLVLVKPIAGDRLRRFLSAMSLPDWRTKRHAARLPLFTEVSVSWNDQQHLLRSLNISASGMLLQPSFEAAIGEEVGLSFKIPELRASLNVRARIIRKEGSERVAVQFTGLAPEDQNAIQVYVTGRLKEPTPARDLLKPEPKRLFRPY
jgi:two-component system, chemotaxis family, chemotaxis protein CheY